jgi:transposase
MKKQSLVSDDLWEAIEPLLPKEPPKPQGGRPRDPDRAVLGGIIFVLRTGCPWRLLPQELGCGSGTTCWRRLRDWQAAGVWERLHTRLLNWLGDEATVDWSRATVDSVSVRAKRGASRPVPIQRIAARPGRSTTWSSTALGSRSPSGCLQRTPTMAPRCCPWSTPSRPSLGHGGSRGGPASARPSCTPTRRTTRSRSAAPCAPAASPRGSLAAASSRAGGWGDTAGSSSVVFPGCSAAGASACATSDGRDYSRGCCT